MRQQGSETNSSFGDLKKILYPTTCKCFIIFIAVLYIIWTSTIP